MRGDQRRPQGVRVTRPVALTAVVSGILGPTPTECVLARKKTFYLKKKGIFERPWAAECGGTSSDPPAVEFFDYDDLGIDDDDFG